MMTMSLALLILFASALMVLMNLRAMVQDTFSMLATCASRARASGQLTSRAAFVLLWLLIFSLSFA